MPALLEQAAHRAKAIAGGVLAACVAYAGTALQTGNGLTLHGLEIAVVAAVIAGLGVHTVPNTPKAKTAKKA